MNFAIEAEQLKKKYDNIIALNSLSLKVSRGEIFGFLGPNGAGKSTFIKILLGLISYDEGSITVFGAPVRRSSTRKKIGYLPENIRVYGFFTVDEFLRFHSKLFGIDRKKINHEIETCLKTVGLEKIKKRRLSTLSKGMLQRIGIAQAILGNPKLLLLDEPTSGLDPVSIKDFRELLLKKRQEGTTIFLSSHLLSEIEKTCDRVAILNKGRVVMSGEMKELASRKEYIEIVVDSLNDAAVGAANDICKGRVEVNANVLKLYPDSEGDAVEIHKAIFSAGAKVLSFAWKGESLEDVFYNLIKKENQYNDGNS